MLRKTSATEFSNMLKFRNMLLCVDMFKVVHILYLCFLLFLQAVELYIYNLYNKRICSVGVDTFELLETTHKKRVFPRYHVWCVICL